MQDASLGRELVKLFPTQNGSVFTCPQAAWLHVQRTSQTSLEEHTWLIRKRATCFEPDRPYGRIPEQQPLPREPQENDMQIQVLKALAHNQAVQRFIVLTMGHRRDAFTSTEVNYLTL